MRMSLACVGVTGAVLTAGALVLLGAATAFSVGVGAALALGNLWALARIVVELLPPPPREGPRQTTETAEGPRQTANPALGGWAVLGALKMIGLMAVVWLLLRHGVVSALPMIVGFGALPLGIAIGSVVSDRGDAD
jgi:hypothetical protein